MDMLLRAATLSFSFGLPPKWEFGLKGKHSLRSKCLPLRIEPILKDLPRPGYQTGSQDFLALLGKGPRALWLGNSIGIDQQIGKI